MYKALALLLFASLSLTEATWTSPKKLTLYHTNWATYGRNYQVKDIPIDYVSDISYAFFNVLADGSIVSGDTWADFEKRFVGVDSVSPADNWNSNEGTYGNMGQFLKLKQAGKDFAFMISIGGWTWSKYFSDAVSTPSTRQNLANNIVVLMKKYPFINGVSIDWEYLSNDGINHGNGGNSARKEDDDNFVSFLELFKTELAKNGLIGKRIAMCAVAAPEKMRFNIARLGRLLDQLDVMTYDFHDGNWGEMTAAHQASLAPSAAGKYSVVEAVNSYLEAGFPAEKIMIGAAYYSRGFSNTNGLGRPASGGSPDKSWESGIVDYKSLPVAGATEYFDSVAMAGYSYDPVRKVLNSYDTVESVQAKCQYVKEKGLLGIIVWEASGDTNIDNPRSLTKAMYDCFHDGNVTVPAAPEIAKVTTQSAMVTTTIGRIPPTQSVRIAQESARATPTITVFKPVTTAAITTSTPVLDVPPASGRCTLGYYQCSSTTSFRVCGPSGWVTMACGPGTQCVQNGNYIYCGY